MVLVDVTLSLLCGRLLGLASVRLTDMVDPAAPRRGAPAAGDRLRLTAPDAHDPGPLQVGRGRVLCASYVAARLSRASGGGG